MVTSNYFKVGNEFIFIRDLLEAWHRAAALSDKTGDEIWVYKSIKTFGPWNDRPVIGHRKPESIIGDMELEQDEETLMALEDELQSFLSA